LLGSAPEKYGEICFALVLLASGVAVAQDSMQNDKMKADASKNEVQVTGKIGDDGKTLVSDTDSKSWTIANPDAVKGHEGHYVTRTAHVTSLCGQERSPRDVAQDGEVNQQRDVEVIGRSVCKTVTGCSIHRRDRAGCVAFATGQLRSAVLPPE